MVHSLATAAAGEEAPAHRFLLLHHDGRGRDLVGDVPGDGGDRGVVEGHRGGQRNAHVVLNRLAEFNRGEAVDAGGDEGLLRVNIVAKQQGPTADSTRPLFSLTSLTLVAHLLYWGAATYLFGSKEQNGFKLSMM